MAGRPKAEGGERAKRTPISVSVEEPAPVVRGRGSTVWHERLSPLMEKPGEWHRFHPVSSGTTTSLKNRKVRYPQGNWEFTSRVDPESKKSSLYARFLGEQKAAEPAASQDSKDSPGE